MIVCPALKVPPSHDYVPGANPPRGQPGSQGAVSWGNCLGCQHNRGSDEKRLVVKCGHNPREVVEIKSMPI